MMLFKTHMIRVVKAGEKECEHAPTTNDYSS